MIEKKERHHVIPLSLGGTDTPENIVLITQRDHKVYTHGILDIPSRTVRDYRAKCNQFMFVEPLKAFEETVKIQRIYFSRIDHIPKHLGLIHYESLKKQARIAGVTDFPKTFEKLLRAFHTEQYKRLRSMLTDHK